MGNMLQTRLHEEHERCLLYLDGSTRKPLILTAEKQLLERHIPAILDKVPIWTIIKRLFSSVLLLDYELLGNHHKISLYVLWTF